MKVIRPTALAREAADILAPVRDDVVVIGAVAVEVAAAEAKLSAIDPTRRSLPCANAACTLALKQAAFGRSRPRDRQLVERDYHDAYLLISSAADAVAAEFATAEFEVRERVRQAVSELAAGEKATITAARQVVRLEAAESQREAEAAVRRAATQMKRRLDREHRGP